MPFERSWMAGSRDVARVGAWTALVSLVVCSTSACSSNDTTGGGGGGPGPADAAVSDAAISDGPGPLHPEGATTGLDAGDDSSESGPSANDGTTGKPCQTNADCTGPSGAGVNRCSNDPAGVNGSGNAIFPTPICFDPTPCLSPTDGNIHYCDGPDDPSSPGLCLGADPTDGTGGLCMPKCTFKADGSPAQGCQGKNACTLYIPLQDTMTGALTGGIGYCYGGACAQDSDCPASNKCQPNEGVCLAMVTLPVTPPGTACNPLSTNVTDACNCLSNPNSSTDLGYCAQFCLVGSDMCPAGTVCDAQEPATVTGVNDASMTGFTMQNAGLAGYCVPTCSGGADGGTADAGGGDGGTCGGYFNAACQADYAAGPDCQPM